MIEKTLGQRLYEASHPKFITLYTGRFPWAEAIIVENPKHVANWRCLTDKCKQEWELNAKGHHLVS